MGYESTVTGDIKFTRPGAVEPSQEEIDKAAALVEQLGGSVSFPGLKVVSDRVLAELQGSNKYFNLNYFFAVNTDGLMATGERGKAFDLPQELQSAIDLVKADGCVVNGAVLVEGGERGDIWRIIIQNSVLREEHGVVTLAWPDGTNQKL